MGGPVGGLELGGWRAEGAGVGGQGSGKERGRTWRGVEMKNVKCKIGRLGS